MATTVKELGEKLDDIYERVTSKLEGGSKELSTKLESSSKDLALKLEASAKELTGKIDNTSDDLAKTQVEVASILAKIGAVAWIGTVAVFIAAILASAGIWKIVEDQKNLQAFAFRNEALIKDNEAHVKERARLLKSDLIEQIDRDITSAGSFDALKDKPAAWKTQLQRRAQSLENNNKYLEEAEKTKYFMIVKALAAYLELRNDECLRILKFEGEDEDHFGYLLLRGGCLARSGDSNEADKWFKRANDFSSDRAQMLDLQRAYSATSRWTASKKPEDLRRAITIYEGMIDDYPRYFPAHFNLAGAYSLDNSLPQTTSTLKKVHVFTKTSIIAEYITRDMLVEKDYENYVRRQLGVVAVPTDNSWSSELQSALEKEIGK